MAELDGSRVAIVATDGFEQSELLQPRDALRQALRAALHDYERRRQTRECYPGRTC